MLHIYTAAWQMAARAFRLKASQFMMTDCCAQRRKVANVEVQVYYDKVNRRCISGRGCRRGQP